MECNFRHRLDSWRTLPRRANRTLAGGGSDRLCGPVYRFLVAEVGWHANEQLAAFGPTSARTQLASLYHWTIFTAFFGLVERLQPDSFASSSGAEIGWQQFLYYSYVTLTTLGYCDITPVKFYAQSLATFEAVLGVLYTVILLSRSVSL